MAGLGAKDILRNITALEQLIEEINFQRAKEMRQCLMSKDSDTGFVMVHGTTYWTDLFVRHFLFQTDRSTDADDLLFFIRKKQMKGSRYIPKYQTEVEVYRKDSRKLPIGDPDIDWEETVYLNLIIHQFDYTLTLAVCTRTSPKELQVLRRHSQKVYASPSRRRMDTKGEVEEITYPNVCFHVDNFDEVFADMLVRDGEMVCVELVASDHAGTRQAVIFLGSIRYDALKRVYDARASLSSKVAQRMMMGLFSGSNSQRIEFVRMKGPQGKGHAEMAVTKPKGSGVETPTSEPGLSLTDLWDPDWEDEPEDRFFYVHQRRLSDPSANFNTFINSGWVSRAEGRSRSENEGLDNFANGLYEIESGDVRDATSSCRCCSVVACRRVEDEESGVEFFQGMCATCEHFHGNQELLDDTRPVNTSQHELVPEETNCNCSDRKFFSEKACDHGVTTFGEGKFVDRFRNRESDNGEFEVVEAVEASEDLEKVFCGENLTRNNSMKEKETDITNQCCSFEPDILLGVENIPLFHDSQNLSNFNNSNQVALLTIQKDEHSFDYPDSTQPDESLSTLQGKPVSPDEFYSPSQDRPISPSEFFSPSQDRPVSPDECDPFLTPDVSYRPKKKYEVNFKKKDILTLNDINNIPSTSKRYSNWHSFKKAKTTPGSAVRVCANSDLSCEKIQSTDYIPLPITEFNKSDIKKDRLFQEETLLRSRIPDISDYLEKCSVDTGQNVNKNIVKRTYSSGPVYYRRFSFDMRKIEKTHLLDGEREKLTKSKSWDCVRGLHQKKSYKRDASVPFRVTKDGTKVYFLCDLKLDDGAYNPLWTTKGFTQTFHFWKESRRAQSVPLNAYLTYVTLPWFTIITDILDHRTGPILTF